MQQPDRALQLAMDTIGRATPAALAAELAREERGGLRFLLHGALAESQARAASRSGPPENKKPLAEAQNIDELRQMLETRKNSPLDGMQGFTVGQLLTPVGHVIQVAQANPRDLKQICEALIWVPDVHGLRLRLAQLLNITQYLPGADGWKRVMEKK